MEKQVVSKKRVAAHGEVLIGKREVNAMLDVFFPPPPGRVSPDRLSQIRGLRK